MAADVSRDWFRRTILFTGTFSVVLVAIFFGWIHSYNNLKESEAEVAGFIKGLQTYKKSYYPRDVSFLDPAGRETSLRDLRGKFVVLNVWATFCTPCIKELPSLGLLQNSPSLLDRWKVVAISIDSPRNLEKVSSFINRLNVQKIAGFYDHKSEVQNEFAIKVLPTTFILNARGRVIYKIEGEAPWANTSMVQFLNLVDDVYW